eukprot:CAMPEP_0181042040 /NCGR_PEP_ID=MMETSP1070-20121207/11930_1 /TAXON_ID=265543 /ORGANISM="Minutocellus polymorphus, Strain NH13" /LENGTH=976 /DNA_ID=CAMNT_0023120211 /DNA_START=129 /DNA_END=3059 /DNA_ORIENTATION=-
MPLVKVDSADDYLDVAHLAEDKGSGGAKKRPATGRHGRASTNGGGGGGNNHLDADAMVDVPAFSSHDAPHGGGFGGLLSPAGVSSMIAPRYLARDSHARPRDVHMQVAGPHDSATSLDDNVSVITLETCLRQMETSGASVSAELSEKEMALAAARGEYNARIAAMSRQNSEVQGGGGGGEGGAVGSGKILPKLAEALERQSAHEADTSEERPKDDLGRSGTDRRSSPTGRFQRGDQHRSRSPSGLRNRSSLQDRYSSNANVSGRSHLTHESRTSSASNSRQLHRHLNKHHDQATSMRTIESEVSQSVVSAAESRASHRTHKTSEGLGASMWSASRNREDRLKEQRRVRSRSRNRGKQIMKLVLQEEPDDDDDDEDDASARAAAATASAEAELRSSRHSQEGSEEEEKKEGGGAVGSSNDHQRSHLTEEDQVLSSFSAKEIARRRDYLNQKKMEQERRGTEARKEDRPHDGTASLVGSINRRARNSTAKTLRRLSFHSLDDELDDVDSDVEEGASGSGLLTSTAATRMKSASNTLSNLAAEVSSSAKNMSNNAERGAMGFLSRHSNMDEEGTRRTADLESQVNTLREAFQTAEDHVATLEGRLAYAISDRDRAEDLIRLLEAENDGLKKRVEELERREFGRAMGMTTGKAGMNNTGGTFTVALNDADAGTKKEDLLKGSLDVLRQNRVQPFRQGSMKSLHAMQDFDLESVVSEREPPKSVASAATGDSGNSSSPTHDNDTYDHQRERFEHGAAHESDDGSGYSEDIGDQLRALPSENPDDHRLRHEEKRSSPTSSAQPQKRGIFGLGKLMSNLHNESFAILETLQEENAQGTGKPGAPRGDHVNRPNGVHSHRRPTDDPADVADEISHQLSTDIREWGNAPNSTTGKDTRSAQHLPLKSTASGETAATSYMSNATAPQNQVAGESWLRRQRNNIAKGVNESLRNIGTDVSDGASIASHSVVSQGGFSMNLAIKDELG